MFSSSDPLLTCCPLHLAPPQPVYVSLVNVSGIMMTPVMELLMIPMMTFLMMVTGFQGTGPCLPPLSASLEYNNHYPDGNYGNLSLVKNIQ